MANVQGDDEITHTDVEGDDGFDFDELMNGFQIMKALMRVMVMILMNYYNIHKINKLKHPSGVFFRLIRFVNVKAII
jgi:hypothetical protein